MSETPSVSESFIHQRQKNIKRIINSLLAQQEINPQVLKGTGIDLGCWQGSSNSALRSFGATVLAVEQSQTQADYGIRRGLIDPQHLVIGKAEQILRKYQDPLDFITFFGASSAVDLLTVLTESKRLLKPNGFLLITTIKELREKINELARFSGKIFRPDSSYFWDEVGFLFKK